MLLHALFLLLVLGDDSLYECFCGREERVGVMGADVSEVGGDTGFKGEVRGHGCEGADSGAVHTEGGISG